MEFDSVADFNRYFEKNESLLVVDVQYANTLFGLKVLCMVTNQLDPKELADMNEVSREIEFAMAARRVERDAKLEEQALVDRKAKEEMARLATVGSKYEARVSI